MAVHGRRRVLAGRQLGRLGSIKGTCGKGVSEHEKSLTWPFCGLPAGGGVFGTIEDVISGTPFWDAAVQMDFMDVMIMYARLFDEADFWLRN